VFEESVLPQAAIAHAKRHYRHLATGSRYCAEVLRAHGLDSVSVIPHGVNSEVFCPSTEPRKILEGKFVVFSGGKFELRKGQDIVIRAFKILQDRHPDVILINSWHNSWAFNRDTMAGSSLIRYFPPKDDNHVAWMNALLATHGIDLDRVITVGPRDHRLLSQLYHASDLGLFPNRLEGGNNMVLMEFMACGKPVLVSYNSGHTEIVNRKNAVLIDTHRPMERRTGTELIAVWNDPSLEETIEKLEWCYHHRDALAALARQAAMDMREFSWQRLAKGLLELACSSRPS
jgi:glycosyltransferase involved in cell wall biosynthesis